jgi:hypothetical protein
VAKASNGDYVLIRNTTKGKLQRILVVLTSVAGIEASFRNQIRS